MAGRFATIKAMEYDHYPTWKRHLPWVLRLLLAAMLWIGGFALIAYVGTELDSEKQPGAVLGVGLLWLAMLGASIFFLLTSIGKMRLAWRAFRRARGRFTRAEKLIVAEREELLSAQYAAAELAGHLLEDSWQPMGIDWSVVLHPEEQAICSAPGHYARFYGTDATYMHSSAFFMGRASFVAVGMAITAMGNAARRRQAQAFAQAQWREQQIVHVIVTTQRILCRRNDGMWLSFYFNGVTNIDADGNSGTLILQFQQGEPLMLGGRGGLLAAAVAVRILHGKSGLRSYPGLYNLRTLQERQLSELTQIPREHY
ncbi:hypothetical protein GCM10027417_11020 [Glutamicibacter endophyticus]